MSDQRQGGTQGGHDQSKPPPATTAKPQDTKGNQDPAPNPKKAVNLRNLMEGGENKTKK